MFRDGMNTGRLDSMRSKIEEIMVIIQIEKSRIVADGYSFPADTDVAPLVTPPKVRRQLKGHFGKVYAMHFAGNSRDLVSASQDGKLIIWNSHNMMKSHSIPLRSSWVMTCAFERLRSELVACGGLDNLCSIYKTTQPQVARAACELAGHDGYLSCCRFLDDARILTTSGDSTCRLWDIDKSEVDVSFTDHTGDVMGVALSPFNPKVFLTGSCDATAKLWDLRFTVHPTITFQGHDSDINSVAFFPDGNAVCTGSDDSTCQLFDIRCLTCINKFKSEKILCGITSVAVSHSGRLLFSGMDDFNCYCWDVLKDGMSFLPQWMLNGHDNRVSCLDVSPSGECVCTGSWDTLLKIWA
mmetsp:Transcript_5398/g.17001  ORF Transcript_5398/g.17001 Transcript_5398/m.17001 type:complete len:354 (+) Transcript_5398:135-1196(+)